MNQYCVPEFEMEDDYSILSSSILTPLGKPSRRDDELMELLWQNGQVVMQSQNQTTLKKSPPFKFPDADRSAPREIRSASQKHHHREQQHSVTDQLFMQEDELSAWLHYPISDANFDQDFNAGLLYPSSSPSGAVAPCVSSTVTTSAPPMLRRVSQVSVPASASASESAPGLPIPPARRNELDSARIQNFAYFSRHIPARTEQSKPSNSKNVMRESTVVDSSDTPAMAPESGSYQAMPSNTEAAASGGNKYKNNNAYASQSTAGVPHRQSTDVSLGANKDILGTCEFTVTSSPGGSSGSAEPAAQKAAQAGDRKRKGRELDDGECHSEDADFESEGTKKQNRGSSAKRSRAAEVHNLSERRRRDRINEKMRALQELIPRCNKSDKASMLDDAIEYLKSLQLQVQMMSMGCGMVPMMYPGAQQYIPPMGIGMGMGMDMGIFGRMMPYPNVLAGSALPTPATAAHLGPRFPVPPPVQAPDPSKLQSGNQSDPMLNTLGMQNINQPGPPNVADPYQQYIGLHQMQMPPSQSQAMAQPSTRRGYESNENHHQVT